MFWVCWSCLPKSYGAKARGVNGELIRDTAVERAGLSINEPSRKGEGVVDVVKVFVDEHLGQAAGGQAFVWFDQLSFVGKLV